MLIDGRGLDGQALTADICICGAGPAGISLARKLGARGVSVILVESGDVDPDEDTQALAKGENDSFIDIPIETTRLRFLGGTTNHWEGFTYPYNAYDMHPRPFNNQISWPIGHAELAKYYPDAGAACQIDDLDYESVEEWQKRAGRTPYVPKSGTFRASVGLFSPPTRFGAAYRDELSKSDSIKVLLNSNLQTLEANAEANHVKFVQLRTLSGAKFQVSARAFVLSLGGLETPRILLLSNKQQANGLGNTHDQVGRYFADHMTFHGGALAVTPGVKLDFYSDKSEIGTSRVHGIFVPTAETILGENIGNFRVAVEPTVAIPGVESLRQITEHPLDSDTLRHIGTHVANIADDFREVADVVYKTAFHRKAGVFSDQASIKSKRLSYDVSMTAEQTPNPDSRVVLSAQKDRFDQPMLKLSWRLQEADRHTIRRGFELFSAYVGAIDMGRMRMSYDLYGSHFDSLISTACHHSGTTRMSIDPRQGVVDANCKVHGVDNLYVASSSVFPTYSWVNPTLTITALALRLGDHLSTEFG